MLYKVIRIQNGSRYGTISVQLYCKWLLANGINHEVNSVEKSVPLIGSEVCNYCWVAAWWHPGQVNFPTAVHEKNSAAVFPANSRCVICCTCDDAVGFTIFPLLQLLFTWLYNTTTGKVHDQFRWGWVIDLQKLNLLQESLANAR